jgi:hypothetical protein
MASIVPLTATASQSLQIVLSNQSCQLNVYQKFFGLFMDVSVNDSLIIGGVICQNDNRIVRDLYLGFIGDFAFFDTQGGNDPVSTGLGSRYQLWYLTPTDLGGMG